MDITASAQWSDLAKAYETKKDLNLRELFAADADLSLIHISAPTRPY